MRMIALSRFTTNMKINSTRMSAWNLRSENNHMLTPIASVRPEKTVALAVCAKTRSLASAKWSGFLSQLRSQDLAALVCSCRRNAIF